MNQKMLDALASTIYTAKLALRGDTVDDDDKRIRASGLYDDWSPGSHFVGEIFNADGQTWECFQAYDNDVYPDIAPGNPAWYTFNRPLHGKTKETARPWVAPMGAHDIYRYGEYMVWIDGIDGTVYRCIAANGTNFSPADYPGGWEAVE